MKERNKIPNCENIKWDALESVFQEMDGQKPTTEKVVYLDELAAIQVHVEDCQPCKERLFSLAEKYHIEY